MSHKSLPSVTISIIVPLYNEEGSLEVLHQQIREELTEKELEPYEILFINDGSKDSSLSILKKLQQVDPIPAFLQVRVKFIAGGWIIMVNLGEEIRPK